MKKIIKILSVLALVFTFNVSNVFALDTTVKVFFDKDSYEPGEAVGITVQYYNSEPALIQMNFTSENLTLNNSSTRASTTWEKTGSFQFSGVAGSEGTAKLTATVVELVNQQDETVSNQSGAGSFSIKKKVVEKPVEKPSENPSTPIEPEKPAPTREETKPTTPDNGADVSLAPPIQHQKGENTTGQSEETLIRKIVVPEKISGVSYLSSIFSADGEISPKFSLKDENYTLKLKPGIVNATVSVTPLHPKAKVDEREKIGKDGEELKFTVTAENGNTRVYTVKIIGNSEKSVKIKAKMIDKEVEVEATPYIESKIFQPLEISLDGNTMKTAVYKKFPIVCLSEKSATPELFYINQETKEVFPYIELDLPSGLFAVLPTWGEIGEKEENTDYIIVEHSIRNRKLKVLQTKDDKNVYLLKVMDKDKNIKLLAYNKVTHTYKENTFNQPVKNDKGSLWVEPVFWLLVIVAVSLVGILIYLGWRLYEEHKNQKSN